MKFTNGTWDLKEGIKVYPAIEVSKVTHLPPGQGTDQVGAQHHITDLRHSLKGEEGFDSRSRALRALCTTRHVRHRGDTLNKPTINVELSSPGSSGISDVLEFRASHFKVRVISDIL